MWIGHREEIYDDQFALSTQLINIPHRRSTTVALETCPLYSLIFFCLVSFVLQIEYRLTFFFTVQTLQSLLLLGYNHRYFVR